MFETLMNLVQQNAGSAVVNNPAIPNQQNNAVIETVTQSIMHGLGQQAQGGGLGNLLNMFTGGGGGNVTDHPVTAGVQDNVQQDLMGKLGISPQVASMVASAIVPMVLNKFMHKAADPNDNSVDAGSLMGMLGGGNGGGLGGMLGGLFGGK